MALDQYLYTLDANEIGGPVTEGTPIRNLLGDNLSVTGGQLDAAGGGGGGFSTKATATGQEDEYIFSAGTASDMVVGSIAGGEVYVEQRHGTFAADGVPDIRGRSAHSGNVGGSYLYLWELDVSTATGQTSAQTLGGKGLAWDGSKFVLADNNADYLYEFDESFNVTGGTISPTGIPEGVTWDGQNWYLSTNGFGGTRYIYRLDTNLAVVGGSTLGFDPTGITWDGTHLVTARFLSNYWYELDQDLNVVGGGDSGVITRGDGITWDGERYLVSDSNNGVYVVDADFKVEELLTTPENDFGIVWDGGKVILVETDYYYEFAGSYDFTAGVIS